MALVDNSSFGVPPLATPITAEGGDQFGVPYQHRPDAPVMAGNLAVSWATWFGRLYQKIVSIAADIVTLFAQVQVVMTKDTYLQCNQASLPATLGVADTGFVAEVTDYNHRLIWNGAAWQWAPGENGSGYMLLFEVDPSPTTGWHLYDGATVNYLKSDGTLGSVTLPDLTSVAANAAYPKAGSPNSGPNAAVAPIISGNTTTASASLSATSILVTVPGTGAALQTIADLGHFHGPGTLVNDLSAEPRNLVRRPFFRT